MLSLYCPNNSMSLGSFLEEFDKIFDHTVKPYLLRNKDGILTLELEVPGIKKQDISINISENILEIKGERKTSSKLYIEKRYSLPKNIDYEKIQAKVEDGLLTILLPEKIKEKDKIKSIKIE